MAATQQIAGQHSSACAADSPERSAVCTAILSDAVPCFSWPSSLTKQRVQGGCQEEREWMTQLGRLLLAVHCKKQAQLFQSQDEAFQPESDVEADADTGPGE